eukprot:2458366-Pyramimonas_sp.AAC.1
MPRCPRAQREKVVKGVEETALEPPRGNPRAESSLQRQAGQLAIEEETASRRTYPAPRQGTGGIKPSQNKSTITSEYK